MDHKGQGASSPPEGHALSETAAKTGPKARTRTSPTAEKPPAARGPLAFLEVLGPGLITGASDDDPSGIATYSQAGAQFGYDLGWTMLFSWPLMCAIQEISARIGRVTGRGIAGNLQAALSALAGLRAGRPAGASPTPSISAPTSAPWARRCKLLIGGPALLYVAAFGRAVRRCSRSSSATRATSRC